MSSNFRLPQTQSSLIFFFLLQGHKRKCQQRDLGVPGRPLMTIRTHTLLGVLSRHLLLIKTEVLFKTDLSHSVALSISEANQFSILNLQVFVFQLKNDQHYIWKCAFKNACFGFFFAHLKYWTLNLMKLSAELSLCGLDLHKGLSKVVGTASNQQQRAGKVLQRVTVTESPSHLLCTWATGWHPKVVILAQFAVEKLPMQEAVSRAREHLTRWCTEAVYFHYRLVRPWANSHSRCSCKL